MIKAVAVGLLVVVLVGAGALLVRGRTDAGGPIYTVGQVEAGLGLKPGAWVGRTLRLNAFVLPVTCPGLEACRAVYLLADGPTLPATVPTARSLGGAIRNYLVGNRASFVVSLGNQHLLFHPVADPLLEHIRSVPAVGQLLPAPQLFPGWGIYRVTLQQSQTSPLCPTGPCYYATAADSAPADAFPGQ